MNEQNLPLLKLFLWKCFGIGFVLTFVFGLIYLLGGDSLASFAEGFIGLPAEEYQELWFEFMTYAKVILLYLYLVPALALSCMCCKKCWLKKEETTQD